MPQLMPLSWSCSMIVVLFILIMLIDLYYYKEEEIIMIQYSNLEVNKITYLW